MTVACDICGSSTAKPCPTCHRDQGRNVDWYKLVAKRGRGAAWWNRGKVETYTVCDECGREIQRFINDRAKAAQ